ncbi:MAG TPA: hypothetical protein VHM02_06120 [Thermoanaerobaculia bacterium]|nr:hypothetical protein [Thermoanaerobaculia bacterium]
MRHLDLDLLQAVIDGDLPPKTLLRRLLDHVGELCPDCGEVITALRRGSGSAESDLGAPVVAGEAAPASLRPQSVRDLRLVSAVERAEKSVVDWSKQLRRERRRARAELRELTSLPTSERAQRIQQARTRFRSRTLAELLIEESRRIVRENPAESRSLAALVDVVLLWTPGAVESDWARELSLRARAWEANALRVAGDLRGAEHSFGELRVRLAREVAAGEELHAELCSLEASLRIDQRRLAEARNLLERAAFLHRQAGSREPLARVLLKLAIVEDQSGDSESAVRVHCQALDLLDPQKDASLFLSTVVNLGLYLLELEKAAQAEELLSLHCQELVQAEIWESPRVMSLRGRIALAQGDEAEAENLFLAARAELIRRGDPLRAAVASLDLALLYLAQGKTADLRRMARLIGAIFEAEDLHQEALATVVLFQQAVAAETVTLEAIRVWRRQLESGGDQPRRSAARPS